MLIYYYYVYICLLVLCLLRAQPTFLNAIQCPGNRVYTTIGCHRHICDRHWPGLASSGISNLTHAVPSRGKMTWHRRTIEQEDEDGRFPSGEQNRDYPPSMPTAYPRQLPLVESSDVDYQHGDYLAGGNETRQPPAGCGVDARSLRHRTAPTSWFDEDGEEEEPLSLSPVVSSTMPLSSALPIASFLAFESSSSFGTLLHGLSDSYLVHSSSTALT